MTVADLVALTRRTLGVWSWWEAADCAAAVLGLDVVFCALPSRVYGLLCGSTIVVTQAACGPLRSLLV
jgi:hypothetical protein